MIHHCKGLTLIELLIAVTISGSIVAGAYNLFIIGRTSYVRQDNLTEIYQTLRNCEQLLAREIRMAGYKRKELVIQGDVPRTVFSDGEWEDIEEATPASFTFTSDVDGDGIMETVRYALKQGELVRQMWRWDQTKKSWKSGGGARSVAQNMETLRMSYLILADNDGVDNDMDDDGDSIADELGEMLLSDMPTKFERRYIRGVRVCITMKTARPDNRYIHPLYRDHFRRMTLATTITPRNLGL